MQNYTSKVKSFEKNKKELIQKLNTLASASNQRTKTAALILKDNKIIAMDSNYQKIPDVTGHAELRVLRKANNKLKNKKLENCELYSIYEPCEMCLNAISFARIKRVFYLKSLPNEEKTRNLKEKNLIKLEKIKDKT